MSVSPSFLINILQIELREVENDLINLEKLYAHRHDNSDITNYVFLENTAVLKSEVDSIHEIGTMLDNFRLDENLSAHQMLDAIDEYIKEIVAERQFSEAIYSFAKSKITKISKYLEM